MPDIAVLFTFQLLVGGMGFVALRQTNQDVGLHDRLSSQQVNAVNTAVLSLAGARTDLEPLRHARGAGQCQRCHGSAEGDRVAPQIA